MFSLFKAKEIWGIIHNMRKFILTILAFLFLAQSSYALCFSDFCKEEAAIKRVLNSQVKYANRNNLEKFINTYDKKYISADGFNLDTFSSVIEDIWNTYDNLKYKIEIDDITIKNDTATAKLIEKTAAKVELSKTYKGDLNSTANTIYHLKKNKAGKWKVISDEILDETTTIFYGNAQDLDVKLTGPDCIPANTDYTAMLEFEPPRGVLAIASIAVDLAEYPQKPTKEVFRTLPDDNILERIFTSNDKNLNEFIVASIGLTQSQITESSVNLSLVGFGYVIKRVNVIKESSGGENVKNK